jgi:hypothetical protein
MNHPTRTILYSICLTEYLPRFGFNFPANTRNAVVLPVPFEPTRPKTCPGRGVGKRWSLNELGP